MKNIDTGNNLNLLVLEKSESTRGYVQQLALTKVKEPSILCRHGTTPLAIMSTWEQLIEAQNNGEFIKFIEGNGFDSNDVYGHIEGWEVFECGYREEGIRDLNGKHLEPKIIHGRKIYLPSVWNREFKRPSLSKLNPYLSFYQTKGSVSRTMRRIESLDMETVYDVVLTFPSDVSRLGENEPDEISKRCENTIKKFYSWLATVFSAKGKIGVCANLHTWSSANPLTSHYHSHGLLLGEYLENGSRKRIRPVWFMGKKDPKTRKYLEGTLTRMIKRKWAKLVNAEFNTKYESLDVRIEFIELKTKNGKENVAGHRRLLHKLKYNRRRPLSDLAKYFLDERFVPEKNNIIWSQFLVEYDNKPLTLGFWNRMSKVQGAKPVETMKGEHRCPLCLRVLHYVGFEKTLPSKVQKVFIDRKNLVYLVGGVGVG